MNWMGKIIEAIATASYWTMLVVDTVLIAVYGCTLTAGLILVVYRVLVWIVQ